MLSEIDINLTSLHANDKVCILKDVRANCFCASLLRTQIHTPLHAWERTLRVRFFKKIQDLILKSEESVNGFCVSLLNRLIQDLSDHGASKEPKNPLPELVTFGIIYATDQFYKFYLRWFTFDVFNYKPL